MPSNHRGDQQVRSLSPRSGAAGFGIERSPAIDARLRTVVMLVRFDQRESGLLPVPGTRVAIVRGREDPVLVDDDLGNSNQRIESVRRTARTVRRSRGLFYVVTGKSDGPVESRGCA